MSWKTAGTAAVATICVLSLTIGTASAKTIKLSGPIGDSPGGKISFEIVEKKKRGKTVFTKVKNIEATNVPYGCNDGSTGSKDVDLGSGKLKYNIDGRVWEFNLEQQIAEFENHSAFAQIKKNGKSATGIVRVGFAQHNDETGVTLVCTTLDLSDEAGRFTAK